MERSSSRREFQAGAGRNAGYVHADFFQLSQGFGQVLLLKGLGFAVEQLVAQPADLNALEA